MCLLHGVWIWMVMIDGNIMWLQGHVTDNSRIKLVEEMESSN